MWFMQIETKKKGKGFTIIIRVHLLHRNRSKGRIAKPKQTSGLGPTRHRCMSPTTVYSGVRASKYGGCWIGQMRRKWGVRFWSDCGLKKWHIAIQFPTIMD
ncbi:hypothetical protein V6Z11_A07G130800 [Gossypium hirsutum]